MSETEVKRPVRKKQHSLEQLSSTPFPTGTRVWDLYWYLAAARQEIYFRKLMGDAVLTTDPILQEFKFTNAYRVADRVSQYLISNVMQNGKTYSANTVFFRILLFKTFNKIETWQLLEHNFGDITWESYDYEKFDSLMTDVTSIGTCIYSPAYMHPSFGQGLPYKRKHQCHLKLIERMIAQEAPAKLQQAASMADAFKVIRPFTMIGDFLAYQYVTDLNYSSLTNFTEMEFVSAGPGAIDGISRCFPDLGELTEEDVIRMVAARQEEEFKQRGIQFYNLFGRPLQLIDCQNLFCEIDKYARVATPEIKGKSEKTRIKQKYKGKASFPLPVFPTKWGLNDHILPRLERMRELLPPLVVS